MTLTLPELSLIVLVGASGSGKSTFAQTHFKSTEVLSSDYCRGLVSDDENDQSATDDAFDVLHYIAAKRLAAGRLTVIDATNIKPEDRKPLVALARKYHVLPVAIVFDLPEDVCQSRNKQRADRNFGPHVVRNHIRQLRRSRRFLKKEGFRHIHTLTSPEVISEVMIQREPLWNNRKDEHGPFDIIGDIHGCCDELEELLEQLDYTWQDIPPQEATTYHKLYSHPEGRKVIFLGDLVDRGPRVLDTYQLVCQMVEAGQALCVPGNHDVKLMRKLQGRQVQIKHGLAESLAEIEALPEDMRETFSNQMADFIRGLVSHYVLDDGRLVVAHAGLKETLQGRGSSKVRDFALYGETTGETDEFGLPIRYNWAAEYRGKAMVVYGHTPVPEPEWLNRTINIDTGCVFGGKLTALRYPEREIVSIPARKTYVDPIRPLEPTSEPLTAQQQQDDLLDLADVTGKRIINTRLRRNITIQAENSIAALEVMSRFAVNPKWLIYLPPTMSPPETSKLADVLEHPAEAFGYFQKQGVSQVICEEKHMGSRAIIIVGRNEEAILHRFGIENEGIGICYTRTGRRFFEDNTTEQAMLQRLQAALSQANFWDNFQTDWVCLDCELMPWSAKAQALLEQQYAAVGAAAQNSLAEVNKLFQQAANRGLDITSLQQQYVQRADLVQKFVTAYGHYCWPVQTVDDLHLAPFHILATEGATHHDKTHLWQMEHIEKILQSDTSQLLQETKYKIIDLSEPTSIEAGVAWWEQMIGQGGEGMVIKPLDFVVQGQKGIIQPAIKCRGSEYLRIIYGPEYSKPENLERLRQRSVGRKRSMALREFALGLEALERFVRYEPLRRVHECVFGVLALESEAVDPRL